MLATAMEGGGAEAQVVRLAAELESRHWKVALVALTGSGGTSLGMRQGVADPRGLVRLLGILNRYRPQILHSHLFHANILARTARLLWPAPVVISTLHSMAESGRKSSRIRPRDLAYGLTDPLADATVAVCRAVADRHRTARAVRPRKLRVIPNGVDTTAFRPDPALRAAWRSRLALHDRFVWLAAGRLMWKKDYPTLLRAFATGKSGELLIAGEGPQDSELRALAAELGIAARFLGRVDDMAGLMNAADGLVLSSRVEGLPMVLLEAAACGLPVITTQVGGAAEAVVDGESGFVVPPGDSSALAGAMRRLSALPLETRTRMGERAREHALRSFDIRQVAAEWERTYNELLESAT
jgi:glycosyltransferase involved in cell wall biosynthesis